jgi:PAS domain S-box-containing protein
LSRLQARVRRIAEEKSYLQLIVRLIEQLNPLPGMEDMLRSMLYHIVETIGGTNIKLYYWIGEELHYLDFLGACCTKPAIDDPAVAEVVARRELVEQASDPAEALLVDGVIPGAWSWTFPLLVGDDLVGVIKLENLHLSGASLRTYLPIFFSHAALILSNEIRTYLRQQAEAALRQSEQRYRGVFDQAAVGIARVAPDGSWLEVNQKLCDIFGYPREELLRHSFRDITHPDHLAESLAQMRRLLAGDSDQYTLEKRYLRKTGETVWASLSVSLVRDGEGTPLYFIAVVEDIQSRKRAEAELARYRQHLEDLVAERTRELLLAKEVAESANRMKSVFLANMSHELRTPLNAILGFAQLMARDRRIPEDERDNLAIINRSGQHLLDLINEVLQISRIEAGKVGLRQEVFDLGEMLEGLADDLLLRARTKGLELRLERDPGLPRFVHGDPGKLRQILLNLLSNAVKYTDRGEVVLAVSRSAREAPEPAGDSIPLLLEVRDTGVGIAGPDQERIFEPFFQTEQGIALGEGTGLGLTICREYAQLLGATLSLESHPGSGSVFRLRLPVRPAAAPVAAPPRAGRVVGLARGQPACRMLVAEDQADSRQLMVKLLEQAGFQVRVAGNGRDALEQFRAWHPDLVWMDMRMPLMDGYQATRAIRALPEGRQTPVIALTASAFDEDRAAILAAGCNEVLNKPVDPQCLFQLTERYLGVCFDYAEAEAEAETGGDAGSGGPPPDPARSLAGVPGDCRAALRQAAEMLDVDAVREGIGRIRETDPALAEVLEELTDNFDFGQILALCQAC